MNKKRKVVRIKHRRSRERAKVHRRERRLAARRG